MAIVLLLHAISIIFNVFAVSIVSEKLKTMLDDANVIGNFMMLAFLAIWISVGTYWMTNAGECSSEWFAGYLVTMIFLILGYTIVTLTICLSAAFGLFLFIGTGLTTREEYKEVE